MTDVGVDLGRLLQLPREQEVHRLGEAKAEVRGKRLHHVTRVGGVPIHRMRA